MTASHDRLWLRVRRYIATEQIPAARVTLEALIQREPTEVAARMLLASVILSEGRVREAAAQASEACKWLPNDAEAICAAAHFLMRVGEMVTARECLCRPDIECTTNGQALTALAHAHEMMGDHTTALAFMNRARAVGYENPDFYYFRSLLLQFDGRLQEAQEELQACLHLRPTCGRASLTLARLRKQTSDSNHLDHIRKHLQSVQPGSEDHAAFEFALFKEQEDLGNYDEAFAALERANTIMYGRLKHDIGHEGTLFDSLIATRTSEFLQLSESRFEGPTPIFIVGLPRSGTTLLDRMLDNHSLVISAGERTDFPRQLRWMADRDGHSVIDEALLARTADIDYAELGRRYLAQTQWRAEGKPFYLDKLPPNYMLLGLIHRALPHAPILHLVREPMDVCFSNYKVLLGEAYPYGYNISALAAHYVQYRRLMNHWHDLMPGHILDVSYRKLVTAPELVIREVLNHCGLPYESDCAEVSRNTTAIATLSSTQVREPIHTRSLGEWQRYARQLEPLRNALQHWLNAAQV